MSAGMIGSSSAPGVVVTSPGGHNGASSTAPDSGGQPSEDLFATALSAFMLRTASNGEEAPPTQDGPVSPETVDGDVPVEETTQNLLALVLTVVPAQVAQAQVGKGGTATVPGDEATATSGLPAGHEPRPGSASAQVAQAGTEEPVTQPLSTNVPATAQGPDTQQSDAQQVPVLRTAEGIIPLVVDPETKRASKAAIGAGVDAVVTTTEPGARVDSVAGATATQNISSSAPVTTVREVPVAAQVARQVAVLRTAPDGTYSMTLQITPDDLGPVSVQVTVEDGVVEMTLRTSHEHSRETLAQAVPDLRRYLEDAGLSCNSVEVDLSNDETEWVSQQDAERNREERERSAEHRERAGTPLNESVAAPRVGINRQTTPLGVDLHM